MKNYKQFDIKIIYNHENPKSEKAANNCLNSFLASGYSGEMINGVWRDSYEEFLCESGITFQKFDPKFSKHEAVVACFASHFNIWRNIERPTLILEHDAILSDAESGKTIIWQVYFQRNSRSISFFFEKWKVLRWRSWLFDFTYGSKDHLRSCAHCRRSAD